MSKVKPTKSSPGTGDLSATADRLHSAAIHLLRRVRKEDAIMAEAPARLSALSVLVFGGPMSLGELAAAEQVKPPTMSRVVAGLERLSHHARCWPPLGRSWPLPGRGALREIGGGKIPGGKMNGM